LDLGKLLKINFSFYGLDFLNGIFQASIPFLLKLTGAQSQRKQKTGQVNLGQHKIKIPHMGDFYFDLVFYYSSQIFKGIPDCFTIALNVLGFKVFEL
jgi:hypothetical protein